MTSAYDCNEFPQELCVKPLALVGISGLDTLNNAIHKSIWETFSSNRRLERAPVLFKLIDNAHEFPAIKPKRNTYDWYIPKGILKKNWMSKHLYKIPAVMVIFYDLDWNDVHWNEKMIECVSRVQSMRAALDGRNTRLTVVLIQNTPPLPAGDDVLASERGVALCASCELNSKSLFVLPHVDHLQGYAVRLESAFYDLAQNYYQMEAKNVKAHRDHLNKNTHQSLLVRHQFKMGFLYELKQDNDTAYKHYMQAYNYLLDIRTVDTNALEIRTVAGFINYKLCKLMFCLSLPRDSISQFKAHVDRFKSRIGFQELAFEHYAWLSKQYNVFADVFDEAVKSGLPAVQTQHPGIYYQQAAFFAVQRKLSCRELCSKVVKYPQPDPLVGFEVMEFYGQRPWRPGKITNEPPDPQIEQNGILALQFLEKQVCHSAIIISLYGLAISQYKTYRCPRTRRYLVLKMAEEYYESEDYGKALTLLTHMLWDFRSEKWWDLMTTILMKALRCAYLVANVQDYLLLSLELLGANVKITQEEKLHIYENLISVLKKKLPLETLDVSEISLQNALKFWNNVLSGEINLNLDMSNIESCIDVKARFTKPIYEADEKVTMELFVKNNSLYQLIFSQINVLVTNSDRTSEFTTTHAETETVIKGKEVKHFPLDIKETPMEIGKELQITSITLQLKSHCRIELMFAGNRTSSGCGVQRFKIRPKGFDLDFVVPQNTAAIVARKSNLRLRVDHRQPSLVGEWYPIWLTIANEEKCAIRDVIVEAVLLDEEFIGLTEISATCQSVGEKFPFTKKLPDMQKDAIHNSTFYIRSHSIGNRNVHIRICYMLVGPLEISSEISETIELPVAMPFEVTIKYVSTLCKNISKLYVGEDFAIMPVINSLSPWNIEIINTYLELVAPVRLSEKAASQLSGKIFKEKEGGAEMFLAKVERYPVETIGCLGSYVVQWKRCNGESDSVIKTPIPTLPIDWIPLFLKVNLPAYGLVRTPLLISYEFHNRSHQLVQLDVTMEASEAFMFAGYKQFQVSILPESVKELKYNLYPLIAGSVVIPKICLSIPEDATEGPALRQEQLRFLVDRCLPTKLFVMPQKKGTSNVLPAVEQLPLIN